MWKKSRKTRVSILVVPLTLTEKNRTVLPTGRMMSRVICYNHQFGGKINPENQASFQLEI